MANELEILLDKIQVKTDLTLEEIAKKIGRTRPYLNKSKSKETGNKKLIALLKDRFPDILQNDTKTAQLSGNIQATSTFTGILTARNFKEEFYSALEDLRDKDKLLIEIKESLDKLTSAVQQLAYVNKEPGSLSLSSSDKKGAEILKDKKAGK